MLEQVFHDHFDAEVNRGKCFKNIFVFARLQADYSCRGGRELVEMDPCCDGWLCDPPSVLYRIRRSDNLRYYGLLMLQEGLLRSNNARWQDCTKNPGAFQEYVDIQTGA